MTTCPLCHGNGKRLTYSGGNFYLDPCPCDAQPNPLVDESAKKLYSFTEIVFDGTDAPFDQALAKFQRNNPRLTILATHEEARRALVFFGHNGLEDDDEVLIPVEWRSDLPGAWTWRKLREQLVREYQ